MKTKEPLIDLLAEFVEQGDLPLPFMFFEKQSSEGAKRKTFPLTFSKNVDGMIEVDQNKYYKHISRISILPYKRY
ncbi:MAG TPA: hypothetical protein PKD51_13915 [Saprospiraceae bacterium]|nr:hypothetical protein [Saprospiraceae bacterium]HMU05852.1 hypothetical protein [Saprospiraceae bacterium]